MVPTANLHQGRLIVRRSPRLDVRTRSTRLLARAEVEADQLPSEFELGRFVEPDRSKALSGFSIRIDAIRIDAVSAKPTTQAFRRSCILW